MSGARSFFTARAPRGPRLARPLIISTGHITDEAPALAETDFIIARDGRIAAVYLFFDKLPDGTMQERPEGQ